MKTTVHLNSNIYPKEAIIKAAYSFIDKAYVTIDLKSEYYIIDLELKENQFINNIENEFINELLAQTARQVVIKQTKQIREIILARAFASTIINTDEQYPVFNTDTSSQNDLEDILNDWFDKKDK